MAHEALHALGLVSCPPNWLTLVPFSPRLHQHTKHASGPLNGLLFLFVMPFFPKCTHSWFPCFWLGPSSISISSKIPYSAPSPQTAAPVPISPTLNLHSSYCQYLFLSHLPSPLEGKFQKVGAFDSLVYHHYTSS